MHLHGALPGRCRPSRRCSSLIGSLICGRSTRFTELREVLASALNGTQTAQAGCGRPRKRVGRAIGPSCTRLQQQSAPNCAYDRSIAELSVLAHVGQGASEERAPGCKAAGSDANGRSPARWRSQFWSQLSTFVRVRGRVACHPTRRDEGQANRRGPRFADLESGLGEAQPTILLAALSLDRPTYLPVRERSRSVGSDVVRDESGLDVLRVLAWANAQVSMG